MVNYMPRRRGTEKALGGGEQKELVHKRVNMEVNDNNRRISRMYKKLVNTSMEIVHITSNYNHTYILVYILCFIHLGQQILINKKLFCYILLIS